jgi:hypothetical protein
VEVFALELAVKETGAAQVDASTERLRRTTNRLAEANAISARSAAKATTVLAGLGSAATSASVGASSLGTRLIQLGSSIGLAFGPASVAVTALVVLGATFSRVFTGIREEIQKTVDLTNEATRRMVASMNEISKAGLEGRREALRLLREGDAFAGAPGADLSPEGLARRGLDRLTRELAAIEKEYTRLAKAQRDFNAGVRDRETVGLAALAARELETLTKQRDAYRAIVTELTRIEDVTKRLIADAERAANAGLNVPGVGKTAPDGRGTTVAGTRFDKIVADAQAAISRQMIARAREFGLNEDAVRLLEAGIRQSLFETFANGVTQGILDGFALGIERAIASGSLGEGWKALSAQMLAGLGGAMIEFGASAKVFGVLMERIQNALGTLQGARAVAASVALIAAGAALKGVASRMFDGRGAAGGSGGFGSGSGGITGLGGTESVTRLVFGPTSAGVAAGMTPRAYNNFVVIGPNDPTAQRAIEEIIRKSERRGGL